MKKHILPETIRLIVLDIDGTLLDSQHELQERTRSVLTGCQEKGVLVTIATGKNWDAVRPLAEKLGIRIPLILSNGALLADLGGNFREKDVIPWDVMQKIITICRRESRDLVVYLDDEVYVEHMTHNLAFLKNFGSNQIIEMGSWQALGERLAGVHKCMALDCQSMQSLLDLEGKLRAEIGDALEYCMAMPEILDMTPQGATKGNGLRRLCEILDIPLAAVIAFGDGNNDIDMLTEAGLGVVLSNGMPPAKACADLLVPSNDRNGPAQLLEYLFNL